MISDEIKECEPYLHDVGDAVVIRADLRRGEKYAMMRGKHNTTDTVSESMLAYAWREAFITSHIFNKYTIDLDGGRWFWTDEMFYSPSEDADLQPGDMAIETLLGR